MNHYEYVILFPDGREINPIDHSYSSATYHIGEKIIFEGKKEIWEIVDIQHQIRSGHTKKYILTNLIVSEIDTPTKEEKDNGLT